MEYHIKYSQETKNKVLKLYIEDIENQIQDLKLNKSKIGYEEYRYTYIRLLNARKHFKKQIKE